MRDKRHEMNTKFWSENLNVKEHSQDRGVDEMIILEWISEMRVAQYRDPWGDFSGSIKGREFFDWLIGY
jgi:hypothetical protein